MALDFAALVSPGHTALVTQEVQRGVIGEESPLAELAEAARAVIPNVAGLVASARDAGIPVIHCTAERRADGQGANANARIFRYMEKSAHPLVTGSEAAKIVPEIPVARSDIVLARLHGLSPFQGTELDFLLRNLGVKTIVGAGVSVNVAIQNLAFDAVNAGYQMVVPRDAVAGFPPEYVDMVFEHTLGAVASLPSTAEVLAAWAGSA